MQNLTDGSHLRKLETSHAVINIVPPREIWDSIQSHRTLFTREARCGPHITFVDPFIAPEDMSEAIRILQEVLKEFPPFTIRFERFSKFVHSKNHCTLFLDPICDPPNALQDLQQTVLKAFPQCDGQIRRGQYVPHLSIGSFPSKADLEQKQRELEQSWVPIEFQLKEIYVLQRNGSDPFQVAAAVPLGGNGVTSPPHFGIGSPGSPGTPQENDPIGRTLLLLNMPKNSDDQKLLHVFTSQNMKPIAHEMLRNPNGGLRTCGLIEFETLEEARIAERVDLSSLPNAYILPIYKMAFPGTVGDCCSLLAVQQRNRS
eukprot:TRINITY_DN9706_c0_g1_i1.p1 TRINITY_DN9706_c0_g1~~TRINITY_DN9706_c0_g1_i1.p1  ORF type:complete len:315 (-),score=54.36 TRINITY_DN9706_c0_g1_i1:23-967(-)